MAGGRNNNRGRGGFRGNSPGGDPFRGRGRGRGGRGGRGAAPQRGRGRGTGGDPNHMDDFDFPIQMWPANAPPTRGESSPRARGNGRGHPFRGHPGSGSSTPQRGTDSSRTRGRGRGDPRDLLNNETNRGRGRGGRGFKHYAGTPLSTILQETRPLLRPIVFVRSVHTATLFQEQEEILQPISETVADNEQAHVPTANQVNRVFSGAHPEGSDSGSPSDDEERFEEINFEDVGKLQAEVDAAAALGVEGNPSGSVTVAAAEEKFTGFYVDTTPAPVHSLQADKRVLVDRMEGVLGETQDEDDEIIVYVAPHPRSGRITPAVPEHSTSSAARAQHTSSTSVLTGLNFPETRLETHLETHIEVDTETPAEAHPSSNQQNGKQPDPQSETSLQFALSPDPQAVPPPPVFDSVAFSFTETPRQKQTRRVYTVGAPRSLLKRSRTARRRSIRTFGSLGAAVSEAHLQEEGPERDPREREQRRGDSDVNWGDSDSGEEHAVDEVSNSIGAMELDEEADISIEAMKSFVKSMSAEGSRHVTMDDVADIEKMGLEDQGDDEDASTGGDGGSSESEDEEVERVLDAVEELLVDEGGRGQDPSGSEDDSGEEGSDDEDTPRRGFQARLVRIRNTQGKRKVEPQDDSSDESMSAQMTRADEDEELFALVEDMLEQNAGILHGKDRKKRNELFRAIRDGDFDTGEFEDDFRPAGRRRDRDVPLELKAQWDKDREKKAENKRKRRQDMLEAAADPMAQHKGGKKGRKAMLAAARLDKSVEVPNRVVDFVSLEQQIRRFLADIGGRRTMSLPPADKGTRKKVHELASAFNLKSQSKGDGPGRYTTLTKTSRSGIKINERKIRRILQTETGDWSAPRGNGKVPTSSLNKHREGEEVGKEAPKIGESNIGFKMLASMGWSEGDRIGLSGGLRAPLTAIMKKTKLGLGATM
ncbi:hypothetical protein B0H21DRAFT_730565 [Amylocystis lapponica]|nr:hypothetical protein B0H21DRAFT_730565 [Amylocystis lapponica]